jgi:hypothetical protein
VKVERKSRVPGRDRTLRRKATQGMSSVLTDKSTTPDDRMLSGVLGKSFKHWAGIKASIQKQHGAAREEWKYYGAKSGWVLKFLIKKRNLFFLIPGEKRFTLGFLFGDRAVGSIEQSALPDAMIREVREARKYAEGRGLRIDVRNRGDVRNVLTLVDIKMHS